MLPKDVLGIIAKLIHRSHIDKLNKEYHEIFEYIEECDWNYFEGLWGKTRSITRLTVIANYRSDLLNEEWRYIWHVCKTSDKTVSTKRTNYGLPPNY